MSLNRRKERETVFQMLFAAEFLPEETTEDLFETFSENWQEEGVRESAYIKETFFGARAFGSRALELIEANAKGWKTGRLSKATLAILKLAIYEMKNAPDIAESVAINEAVELSKKYDDDGASKFVNGVLGAVSEK